MHLHETVRRSAALALLGGATVGLLWAGPRPGDLPHGRDELTDWLATRSIDATVTTLAALAAEACLLYLALSGLLVALTRLPGLCGRLSGALADRFVPALIRRAMETALGITVATASVTGAAVPALAAPAGPGISVSSTPVPATAVPAPPLPDLDRPAGPPAKQPRPATLPPPATAPRPPPSAAPTPTDSAVVVHRGDSLWRIAARHLGPGATDVEIAAAWPRWYAANRSVIGPDPDLLLPGQRLSPPR